MNPDSPQTTQKSVKDGPVLREHVFDGIQEFDQKLPNWWLFTFYIAIVFFVGFWVVYYSTDMLKSPAEQIDAQMAVINEAKKKELTAMLDKLDDEVLIEWSKNAQITAEGQTIYTETCNACHGPDLKGTPIGRSLVDNEWAHGGRPMEIFNLILNGSPAGATGLNGQKMTAWKDLLGPEKAAKAAAFIISKNPHVK